MGKTLRLKDGTAYTCAVSSTPTTLEIPVENYAAVDGIKTKLTPENLETVEFDGVEYTDMSLISDRAFRNGNKYYAGIVLGLGIEDRIEYERQAAIDAYTLQLIEEGLL